ncbi:MAG: hypothetical protein LBO75_01625 [Bifidobacteriaceae bacterium]|nr:hypothetical protein [Bifidobacteriaceae bacterium]
MKWAPGALAVAGLVLAAGLLGGCSSSKSFDSKSYCKALGVPETTFDTKALIDGDKEALEQATALYTEIGAQAPDSLKDDWDLMVRQLKSMLQAARGEVAVADVDYEAFSAAFTQVKDDQQKRCR